MQGLLSILSLFHNKFNKFNNTGARMLESINHMTFEFTFFALKRYDFVIT